MIKLYTINCPKCGVLEQKLKQKNISFDVITDTEIMKKLGIEQLPALFVKNKILNYKEAINWVNSQTKQEEESN